MKLMRACNCYAIYCEHNPMPFPKHGKWDGTLWMLFARFHWYRRLRGGIWQQFDGRAISSRPPYPIWLQVTQKLRDALKTEDYRRPPKVGGKDA